MSSYYRSYEINDITEVAELFANPDHTDFTLNWLFLSTSGVHGSYATLDDLETWEPEEPGDRRCITVLVVKPRIVQTLYGTVEIQADDIPWLREAVRRTLAGIQESQKGNS